MAASEGTYTWMAKLLIKKMIHITVIDHVSVKFLKQFSEATGYNYYTLEYLNNLTKNTTVYCVNTIDVKILS